MTKKNLRIAVIILNYNDYKNTCHLSYILNTYNVIDIIIIVDNKSTDDSYLFLQKLESDKVKVIQSQENKGYSYGNNFGVKYLKDNYDIDYVMIANPDVEVEEKVILEMSQFSKFQNAACVSPLSLKPDRSLSDQIAWNFRSFFIETITTLNIFAKIIYSRVSIKQIRGRDFIKVDILPGSLLFINMEKFVNAGLMDEKTFLYCEERILGKRLQKLNYTSYLLINQTYVHRHSESINKSIQKSLNRKKIYLKSRTIYLKNYYKMNILRLLFIGFIHYLALVEAVFIEVFKSLTIKKR